MRATRSVLGQPPVPGVEPQPQVADVHGGAAGERAAGDRPDVLRGLVVPQAGLEPHEQRRVPGTGPAGDAVDVLALRRQPRSDEPCRSAATGDRYRDRYHLVRAGAPCNSHLHRLAEAVKRGVWQARIPLEFPVLATGETLMRPTAMFYRNLLAMEAEELMRANPLDGVVLLSGCDKTTPGLLMAAASVDLPRPWSPAARC